MPDQRHQGIIRGATETRNIDFKAPMNWRTATRCDRFEILKDIAAMANVGGGMLVIGRNEPDFLSGSMTADSVASFDPTEVNKLVHRYLAPSHECRVSSEDLDGDRVVVIEIDEFETIPLIFQIDGDCGNASCRKKQHFRRSDIFVRTRAQQSERITNPQDMAEMIGRAVRRSRDVFVAEIQRMLAAPTSVEEPAAASPYDTEYEHEQRDFFDAMFYPRMPTLGHYDITLRPSSYQADRLELRDLPRTIVEYAFVSGRTGMRSIPYDGGSTENFSGGVRMKVRKPQWRQIEAVSLHRSGLYRLVRSFPEDFRPNEERTAATIEENDRMLWIDRFVEQITMLHLLVRNIARRQLTDLDEEMQIDLRIDGLARRRIAAESAEVGQSLFLTLHGHDGTENAFAFPLRITLREFELQAVSIAGDRCRQILWTFGLNGESVLPLQRRLLGNTEPSAFPPPRA